ncbi:hypothetical protein SUGI_0138430 [Cryptomeria japonica]|nr:hypothetical protein SUGI_0138430 [Cryptomeria japonica]
MAFNKKSLGQWILMISNCLALSIGGCVGTLLIRFYFLHGGNRIWLCAWLQTAGCPLLFLPIWISSRTTKSSESTHVTRNLCLASAVIGVLTGLDNFLYSWGLAYLPLSTSSLVIAPQLAFNAFFAFFLVKQKFTPYSINGIILLIMGAVMLAFHANGDRPKGVTKEQYWLGFFAAGLAAALYGFILPLIELVYKKTTVRITYTLVMEMQLIMSFSATVFCTIGMLVNKDFQAIGREASLSDVEVLAVILFHEKFTGEKGMALAMALWGFTSYFYGEYKSSIVQTSNMPEEHRQGSESAVTPKGEELSLELVVEEPKSDKTTQCPSKPKKEWRKRNEPPLEKVDSLAAVPPSSVLDSVLVVSCPELVIPTDLDPTSSDPREIVGVPSPVTCSDGVSPTSFGSSQDIPIQLIVDMDNSFELNPHTGSFQDPPPEDPVPFIEVKQKNRRRNSPIGLTLFLLLRSSQKLEEGTPLLAKSPHLLGGP